MEIIEMNGKKGITRKIKNAFGAAGLLLLLIIVLGSTQSVEARASKKALKFLKGTWVTAGNSNAIKVKFTKDYMNFYNCFSEDHTIVYKYWLGKYEGKMKILSTSKKDGEWYIKVGKKKDALYFIGKKDGLLCKWKENGRWMYSASDSLQRLDKDTIRRQKKRIKKLLHGFDEAVGDIVFHQCLIRKNRKMSLSFKKASDRNIILKTKQTFKETFNSRSSRLFGRASNNSYCTVGGFGDGKPVLKVRGIKKSGKGRYIVKYKLLWKWYDGNVEDYGSGVLSVKKKPKSIYGFVAEKLTIKRNAHEFQEEEDW